MVPAREFETAPAAAAGRGPWRAPIGLRLGALKGLLLATPPQSRGAEGLAQHSGLDGETSIRDRVAVRRPVTLVANASQCPSKTKPRSVRAY